MPVRNSMTNLILTVRKLINDEAKTVFTQDQDIQDALDRYREDVRYLELIGTPTLFPGPPSSTQFLTYYAPDDLGDWEDDIVLYNYSFAAITPSTSDNLVGKWTFAANQWPPVWVIGQTYDVHMAASMLVREWASKKMLSFDASQMGTAASRSQMFKMLNEQAGRLASLRRPRLMTLQRPDVAPEPRSPLFPR